MKRKVCLRRNDADLKERSFTESVHDLVILKCGCKRKCMRLAENNYEDILDLRRNFWGERHETFTSVQRRRKLEAIALKAQTGNSLGFKFYLDTSIDTATEVSPWLGTTCMKYTIVLMWILLLVSRSARERL